MTAAIQVPQTSPPTQDGSKASIRQPMSSHSGSAWNHPAAAYAPLPILEFNPYHLGYTLLPQPLFQNKHQTFPSSSSHQTSHQPNPHILVEDSRISSGRGYQADHHQVMTSLRAGMDTTSPCRVLEKAAETHDAVQAREMADPGSSSHPLPPSEQLPRREATQDNVSTPPFTFGLPSSANLPGSPSVTAAGSPPDDPHVHTAKPIKKSQPKKVKLTSKAYASAHAAATRAADGCPPAKEIKTSKPKSLVPELKVEKGESADAWILVMPYSGNEESSGSSVLRVGYTTKCPYVMTVGHAANFCMHLLERFYVTVP